MHIFPKPCDSGPGMTSLQWKFLHTRTGSSGSLVMVREYHLARVEAESPYNSLNLPQASTYKDENRDAE